MKSPLKLTALQRLGKRVDQVASEAKAVTNMARALHDRLVELERTFATTAHSGNWEAMYRLEREENLKLAHAHATCPQVETTIVEGWIAQLEAVVQRLQPPTLGLPTPWPCGCRIWPGGRTEPCGQHQLVNTILQEVADRALLTPDETRVVERAREAFKLFRHPDRRLDQAP